ncbi:hypothetical protein ACHAC9_09670 [Massilia sp. CMS3.1]|uniref:hypothetical protein n=1 Tax=Massilia sp. CMS3.1 TaxID=3373083 RepID=UPI003EE70E7B
MTRGWLPNIARFMAMLPAIRDKLSMSGDGQVPSYGIIMSSGHASGREYLLNPATD